MYAHAARRDGITKSIGFEPSNAAVQYSVELMLAEMDEAGVDLGVVVGRNSPQRDRPGVLRRPSRPLPFHCLDRSNRPQAAVHDIDEAIAAGFLAVNIEPGGASPPLHIDDRRIYPIYAHCEDRELPVILMTGGNAGPDISYSSPEHLDRVLGDFPALRVVPAHGNWPWVALPSLLASTAARLRGKVTGRLAERHGGCLVTDSAVRFPRRRYCTPGDKVSVTNLAQSISSKPVSSGNGGRGEVS